MSHEIKCTGVHDFRFCVWLINKCSPFLLTVKTASSVMGMQVLLGKGLQWRISTRRESMVLMERPLDYLAYSTVLYSSTRNIINCLGFGMSGHPWSTYLVVHIGHGGARAAEYVKQHLFSNLIKHPKFISDIKSAIGMALIIHALRSKNNCSQPKRWLWFLCTFLAAETYNHTDSEFLKAESSHTRDAGSTASTAILVGDRLLVANVGDSRAVVCRGGDGKSLNLMCVTYFS